MIFGTDWEKRFIFAEKENGNLVLRRNFKIREGEKILVVEDVITRGGRVQESIDIIKAHGGVPAGVAVLVLLIIRNRTAVPLPPQGSQDQATAR